MAEDLIKALASILPHGDILAGEENVICYGSDATRVSGRPDAVVRPGGAESIRAVIEFAAAKNVPVVPRGAGTGLSGGCVPVRGGIVVATEKLNRIIELDPVDLVAVVEPGVVTASLHEAAERENLFYPPDPASFRSCTLGGNIAENAGGLRGLKYGVTRDYVMSLKVTLPSGKEIKAGARTLKNVTGYDLTRLMVGSEGTLGFITEATLKLIPKPETKACFLAAFDTLETASEAVVSIIKSGITPSTLEVMDSVTLNAVAQYRGNGDGLGHGALLLMEVDGSEAEVKRQAAKLDSALKDCRVKELRQAADPAEQESLWGARRAALTALARVSPSVVLEDATVPRKQIPAMVRAIRAVAEKYGLLIGTFGHAGDGNLHPTIITDLRVPGNRERVHAAVSEIFDAALSLGGTLSGEHGIGFAKASFMERELGEAGVAAMRAVKDALDPQGIMNPGKIFI
ncbi:MAG TPA: FAD-linked oxidase C-terminal domain-containing protein [Nitrospirota bacterium]|nr:FAD-linked oxidase C-terminal domain-containing protein [Nitrospirota bacterium]